mgnify:CR=1 FL=1|tara:strand:+ start:624 stop:1070 length:447 start_codon:yes stop_codon:yes gene_type:complete
MTDTAFPLGGLTIASLRSHWTNAFGTLPPPRAGRELLELGAGWQQQSKTHGGHDRAVRESIALLVSDLRSGKEPGASRPPQKINAGATLVREWRGKTYQVQVLDKGYVFENRVWRSLSEIAREITGAHWNGLLFFGVKKTGTRRKEAP